MTSIEELVKEIDKKFGVGSMMRLGDKVVSDIPAISTTSISLDRATGIGGIPRGRITEIYGPESSGKTTLTLHIIAEAQKAGGVAAFIDAEHALDTKYAENLGVNIQDLYITQPSSGDEALEIAEMAVRSGEFAVVVIDSVAALVPKAELAGDMGNSFMGLHARLMSQAMRKLTAVISKTNTSVVFINQIRNKIGIIYGSPEVTTGGRALQFYASLRLDIRRTAGIAGGKEGDPFVGNRTRVKVVKNKFAPPFKQCEFDIVFGEGISKEGDVLDFAAAKGIVKRSGAWYAYEDEKIGQGREKAKQTLIDNPGLYEKIRKEVLEAE